MNTRVADVFSARDWKKAVWDRLSRGSLHFVSGYHVPKLNLEYCLEWHFKFANLKGIN